MTARKRLDEMKQFIKITEGAWDLPRTKEDFDKVANILRSKEPNVKIYDMLFNVLGDDDLFDRLEKLNLHDYDAPETIIQWMKDQRKNPNSNFPNIWNTYQLSQREDSPMNEVGRTSLDDYREETDDEWEARVSQPPIEDEEYGPAARGKSDIMKKWGAQQSTEVTDLSLSEDDEDSYPEAEATRAMYAKHETDDFQNRGDSYPRGGTPVRIDSYAHKNQASLSFAFKNTSEDDARAFVSQFMQQHGLPVSDIQAWQDGDYHDDWVTAEATYTVSKELDEVGAVKFDDYGAVDEDGRPGFQYDNDPDGMGRYEVVVRSSEGEDYQTGDSIPYDQAEILAKETIENIVNNIPGDSIVTKEYKGDSVWFKIVEPAYEMTSYVVIEPDEMYESIDLSPIVEGLLQEFPGQPKDYEYEDSDQREMADDMDNDYEQDEIDPEYEDSELGLRFD